MFFFPPIRKSWLWKLLGCFTVILNYFWGDIRTLTALASFGNVGPFFPPSCFAYPWTLTHKHRMGPLLFCPAAEVVGKSKLMLTRWHSLPKAELMMLHLYKSFNKVSETVSPLHDGLALLPPGEPASSAQPQRPTHHPSSVASHDPGPPVRLLLHQRPHR